MDKPRVIQDATRDTKLPKKVVDGIMNALYTPTQKRDMEHIISDTLTDAVKKKKAAKEAIDESPVLRGSNATKRTIGLLPFPGSQFA